MTDEIDIESEDAACILGISPDEYDELRWEVGLTQSEIFDADAAGVDLYKYGLARKHASREEALDAHRGRISLQEYAFGRSVGASHKEILQAVADGTDAWDYATSRNAGATHDEILAADRRLFQLDEDDLSFSIDDLLERGYSLVDIDRIVWHPRAEDIHETLLGLERGWEGTTHDLVTAVFVALDLR